MKSKPRYVHHCKECAFLGAHFEYDLYTCPQEPIGKTYIARYGNNGPDYSSMPLVGIEGLTLQELKKTQTLMALFKAYKLDQP